MFVTSTDLEKLSQAERMLAEVASTEDAMNVIDYAEAARVYAQRAKLGTQAVNHATTVKLRAERRLANMVDEGQAKGQIVTKTSVHIRSPEGGYRGKTLADIGVTPQRPQEARAIRDSLTDEAILELAAEADAPWWNEVYANFFPGCLVQDMRDDGWWQRAGIDKRLHLRNGTSVSVDEKVREQDRPDFALEAFAEWTGSNDGSAAGWMELAAANQLACDYLAYAYVPSRTCYLLPMRELARAWVANRREWWILAGQQRRGFRFADAKNLGRGGRAYTTRSICVPRDVVFGAITDVMRTTWSVGVQTQPTTTEEEWPEVARPADWSGAA